MSLENSTILNFIKKYWIIILILIIVALSIDYNYFGHDRSDNRDVKEEKIDYPSRQFAEGIVYSNQEYFVFKHLINNPACDSVTIEFPGSIWCTYVRTKTNDGWLYTKIK